MSTQPNDGGPAFPWPAADGAFDAHLQIGISLRDWFSVHATENDIEENRQWSIPGYGGTNRVAKYTREEAKYRYADAMLAAREKKG